MRKLILIIGAAAIVVIAAIFIWKITNRQTDTPIIAVPEQNYAIADVTFFLQNDPQWADDTLGASHYKMAGSGCLVTCMASSLCAQGIDIDPGRLNKIFTENDVYNSEGEILWNNISKAFPDIRVTAPANADAANLEKAVEQGLLPIVKVKYKGNGYQHWVLLIGANEDGYLCMDPLNPDKEPQPLSKHDEVIYRYRIVTVI
jgi:hypothetical protein